MGIYKDLDRYTQMALLRTALNAARDDVDKREGSVLYDALAPLAFLAAKLMEIVRGVAENADIQTAQGEHLDWAASQFGIYRTEAEASVREAQKVPQGVATAVGDTFKTEAGLGLIWECTEVLDGGLIVLQCHEPGKDGGADYGQLVPQGEAEGLQSLTFTETRNPGRDAETDAAFRIRFWKELQRESYGGNFADYQSWIFTKFAQQPNGAALAGVSFFPAWDGGGTVKIVPYVEDGEGGLAAPTAATLAALKEYLDPEPQEGKGAGVAPIGHAVTVEAPTFAGWGIEAAVVLRTGQEEITDGDREEAEKALRAAIAKEQGASVTKAESGYPDAAGYTFEFSKALVTAAVIGDAESPRFLDVKEVRVNGVEFDAISITQTAQAHIMPRLESLTLSVWGTP